MNLWISTSSDNEISETLAPKRIWGEKGWRGHNMFRRKYLKQGGRCAVCNLFAPVDDMTVDHIIPRARGGIIGKNWENAQLVCEPCNRGKGDA